MTGKTCLLYMESEDTVFELRRRVADYYGFPFNPDKPKSRKNQSIMLIFQSKRLESDELTLSQAGLRDESCLHLVVRMSPKVITFWDNHFDVCYDQYYNTAQSKFNSPSDRLAYEQQIAQRGQRYAAELHALLQPPATQSSSEPPPSAAAGYKYFIEPIGSLPLYHLFAWRIAVQSPSDSVYQSAFISFSFYFHPDQDELLSVCILLFLFPLLFLIKNSLLSLDPH